jgi:glycosyl transferase family 2
VKRIHEARPKQIRRSSGSKSTAGDGLPEVSIVLPCLNEAETVGLCVQKALQGLSEAGTAGEVIVADNGSIDGSQELAARSGATVIHVPFKGYGSALMGGIAAARGRYIIMADADDSYDLENLGPFIDKLREGYDVVMGNRFRGEIRPGAMPHLHRYVGNPALSFIGRLLFGSPTGDFHCGMRGFTKQAVDRLELRTTGMEFASEVVVKATLQGMRIAEVPTTLSPAGRSRPPHLRSWRDGWRHLRFLLLYSPRWLFLVPGALLVLAGLGVSVWLLPGPRFIGGVEFNVGTLLAAMVAVVVGFQSVLFALFTKVFATTEGLVPEDPRFTKLFRYVTLETGLVVGAIFVATGVSGALYALVRYSFHEFALNLSSTLRIVIPSLTAFALGCQILLGSFFLSVLGLKRRR